MPTDICDCDTDYKGAAATCNHNPGNQKSECGHRLQFSSSVPAAWQINAHPRTALRKTSPVLREMTPMDARWSPACLRVASALNPRNQSLWPLHCPVAARLQTVLRKISPALREMTPMDAPWPPACLRVAFALNPLPEVNVHP